MLALGALADPDVMRPGTVLAVPVLLGGLSLPLREFRLLVLGCFLLVALVASARGLWVLSIGSVLIFVAVVAVSYEQTRRRERLGVRRARPDQILLDLRERLRVQGEVPPLPAEWGMEVELRPADDAGLAGDFVVSRVHAVEAADGWHDVLDLALVDVSGKGVDAGTRALLLSGALGGLLGAVPPEDFLAEANRYLLQQRWAEGFATAAYLRVDLATGAYRVESAGHPPVAAPGRGQRHLAAAAAPRPAARRAARGRPPAGHRRCCAAATPCCSTPTGWSRTGSRDLEVGVDRLLGAAERLVPRGDYRGGAALLVREVPTNRATTGRSSCSGGSTDGSSSNGCPARMSAALPCLQGPLEDVETRSSRCCRCVVVVVPGLVSPGQSPCSRARWRCASSCRIRPGHCPCGSGSSPAAARGAGSGTRGRSTTSEPTAGPTSAGWTRRAASRSPATTTTPGSGWSRR